MPVFERDFGAERIPVTLVLGAGGSGKTTVLNRLAADPSAGPCALLVNDFGTAVPCAAIVEAIQGPMVPHAIGCLCCTGRSGLVDALRRQFALRERGGIRFRRVLVEAAAGADPAPLLQTLLNNALVTQYYRLDGLVSVIDATTSPGELRAITHDWKQVTVADRVVLTRSDIAGPNRTAAVATEISAVNPSVTVIAAEGTVELARALLGSGYHDLLASGAGLKAWLPEAAAPARLPEGLHRFILTLDEPVDWDGFHDWLDAGMRLNGDVIHRLRGVLDVRDCMGPVLVQGVQQVLQPPVLLTGWGGEPRRSRLEFVTHQLDRDAVAESLERDLPALARNARERSVRRMRAELDPSLPA